MAKLVKTGKSATDKKQSSRKKTWQEKLHIDRKPEVEVTTKKFADIPPGSTLLKVEDYIRQIPS